LKTIYKLALMALIIFGLCFSISTFGYSEVDPSIISVRVVRYGFPMTWLKATTVILPVSPTTYIVLWLELIVDIVLYLALSIGISFITMKAMRRHEASKPSLWVRVLFVVLVAYPTRLLSCGIHELLGHGLWAWIFGADRIWFNVSWLGFGWCRWQGLSDSYIARVMTMAGGLINTFIIGAAILTFLFLVRKKGGFCLRFFLFWLGFWTTINQASYLLLGGLTGYGDPGSLHSLTGIPLSFFILLGFGLFLVVYLAVSVLFLSEATGLFPEFKPKTLLFEFWITIPIQAILFAVSPEHEMLFEMFFFLLAVSVIPSLLSLLLFQFFNRWKLNDLKDT